MPGGVVEEGREVVEGRRIISFYHFLEYAYGSILKIVSLFEKMLEKALPFLLYLEQLPLTMLQLCLQLTDLSSQTLYIFLYPNYPLSTLIVYFLLISPLLGFHDVCCVFLHDFLMFHFLEQAMDLSVFNLHPTLYFSYLLLITGLLSEHLFLDGLDFPFAHVEPFFLHLIPYKLHPSHEVPP